MKPLKLTLVFLLFGNLAYCQTTPWSATPTVTTQSRTYNGSFQIRQLTTSQVFSWPDTIAKLYTSFIQNQSSAEQAASAWISGNLKIDYQQAGVGLAVDNGTGTAFNSRGYVFFGNHAGGASQVEFQINTQIDSGYFIRAHTDPVLPTDVVNLRYLQAHSGASGNFVRQSQLYSTTTPDIIGDTLNTTNIALDVANNEGGIYAGTPDGNNYSALSLSNTGFVLSFKSGAFSSSIQRQSGAFIDSSIVVENDNNAGIKMHAHPNYAISDLMLTDRIYVDSAIMAHSGTSYTAGYALNLTGTVFKADTTILGTHAYIGNFASKAYGASTYYLQTNPSAYISKTALSATSPLLYNSSTGAFSIQTASVSQAGALSSTDWSTFNGKQTAGSYITALTGDGTASGPGSAALTLATVNSNVGTFGSSSSIPSITVNAKGLITAVTTNTVSIPTGANPTGLAGNAAVNGTSTNFMRADAAPRVDSTQIINYAHYNGTPATWAVNHYQTLLPLTTNGDVLTYNSGLTRIGIGSPGQVLTVISGLPAWQTPPNNFTTAQSINIANTTNTITPALNLIASTAATSTMQSYSPALTWQGNAWAQATTSSVPYVIKQYISTNSAYAGGGVFHIGYSLNGAALADAITFDQSGNTTTNTLFTQYLYIQGGASSNISMQGVAMSNISSATYNIMGGTTTYYRNGFGSSTNQAIATGANAVNNVFSAAPFATVSTGVVPWAANVWIKTPVISLNAGSSITNYATLGVDAPSSAATNNYAIYVAGGLSQFNGAVNFGLANQIGITEGSGGRTGQTTLVSGAKTITISGLTTSSRAIITFVSSAGTVSTTWQYAGVCTANTLTITALTNTASTDTSDTSTLNYLIIN